MPMNIAVPGLISPEGGGGGGDGGGGGSLVVFLCVWVPGIYIDPNGGLWGMM
jgi:hypothetical protein